jgi:hypothetical protein
MLSTTICPFRCSISVMNLLDFFLSLCVYLLCTSLGLLFTFNSYSCQWFTFHSLGLVSAYCYVINVLSSRECNCNEYSDEYICSSYTVQLSTGK